MAVFWNEDRLDILKTYLRNNTDNKTIARKLNTTIDAVSGAIRRYNLQDLRPPTSTVKKFYENLDLEVLDDDYFEEAKKKAKLKWSVPISKRKKTKKLPFKMGLAWPDTHIPHQNDEAVNGILSLMSDFKFDIFVNIGDFMDMGAISHWNRNKHRTLELKRLKNDYIIGNVILDEIDKRLPKGCEKHYLFGNHEKWCDDLLEDIPQLEGMIEPEGQLYLEERGYKTYDYNEIVPFGKLNITHGIYAGANPTKKHLDELKTNIMFGHTHSIQTMLSSSPARQIAFSGYNIGCLCDLSPDYMRNRPNAWQHGFAVFYLFPDGYFDVQVVRIVNGRFIFNNKVYDGKKK